MKIALLATLFVAAACTTAAQPSPSATIATTAAPSVLTPARTSAPDASPLVMVVADCRAPATPTVASTDGPYFRPGSPEKASLVTDRMPGTRVVLAGLVLTRGCTPVARAKVDIWQADSAGAYDNAGYTLRGHVFTDAQGKYSIETVVPAPYPGRTPHIHAKVTPPGGAALTTQLYFPGSAQNASDGIFRSDLLLKVTAEPRLTGMFVFVLDLP